jgi:protein arginine N-methyltransferase 1
VARSWFFPSIGEYPVYSDFAYAQLGNDQPRVRRYADAVRRHAPGRTVLDIGTGADALWALAAARAGAKHVWAVEVLPRSAQLARETVAKAGFADRVTIVEGLSTEVWLPEPVEVCVSEVIGTIAGSEGVAPILHDAAKRLVAPGGIFIPARSASTIVAIDLMDRRPGLQSAGKPFVDEVFDAVGRPFDLRMTAVGLRELADRAYLSDQAEVELLEFGGDIPLGKVDRGTLTFRRAGRFHGLALGMRLWVDDIETEPLDSLNQHSSWLPVYAPLSNTGIPVQPGDRFEFEFTATLSDDGVHPDYEVVGEFQGTTLWWRSTHHADGFRSNPFYEQLFP